MVLLAPFTNLPLDGGLTIMVYQIILSSVIQHAPNAGLPRAGLVPGEAGVLPDEPHVGVAQPGPVAHVQVDGAHSGADPGLLQQPLRAVRRQLVREQLPDKIRG